MKRKSLLVVSMVLFLFGSLSVASATPVDLELVVAVDISGSIDGTEFDLQKTGYKNAFQDGLVQNALLSGPNSASAVTFVYWSGSGQQQQSLAWTLIDSAADANAFGAAIDALGRPYNGATAVGEAIQFSAGLFAGSTYTSTNRVIDISGDGSNNTGIAAATARDNALAGVVDRINGLAILGSEANLDTWYTNNVIGGAGSFLETAANYNDFGDAIKSKITAEAEPIPEPATMLLLGTGLVGVAGAARRKRKNQA